ncbi:hypothetical protein COT97_03325 [Candidatus Falkowbacteria bacterium CG10_big_fil_rev_8_21_14_0_10_39_11]|uniref:Uncharacterized protein n=1 Tax=Candidatus Falkowbacteria bacterium CG10_big_fil_rev_8_21_14_0_10_39_11 TaxID=1974565 RepID=A0A2H0V6J7_9BACT|nr:MAG: hypothetical protein COT97_03325 [Candidatus Falkowbacteria bacterium CG10_big_fil_rev_8_21_14_0_10_39_11]
MMPIILLGVTGVVSVVLILVLLGLSSEHEPPHDLIVICGVALCCTVGYNGLSSLFVEFALEEGYVVSKDNLNDLNERAVWCTNGCANVSNEMSFDALAELGNHTTLRYTIVIVPDKENFPYFVAKLPFNDDHPLTESEVKDFLGDLLTPLILDLNKRLALLELAHMEVLNSSVMTPRPEQVTKAILVGEIYKYLQPRLMLMGFRLDRLEDFRITSPERS